MEATECKSFSQAYYALVHLSHEEVAAFIRRRVL